MTAHIQGLGTNGPIRRRVRAGLSGNGWVNRAGGVIAKLDLDFVGGRAFQLGQAKALSSVLSCTRAGTAYYTQATGTLTSFAPNTLRYGSNGLLVEESRTNSLVQSNNFTTTWSPNQLTSRNQDQTGPDGIANSAWTLTANGIGLSLVSQTISVGTGSVLSACVKAGTAGFVFLRTDDAAGSRIGWFNLSTGAAGTINAVFSGAPTHTQTTPIITPLANGWYRVSLFLSGATTTSVNVGLSDADNSTNSAAGHTLGLFGAQQEVGATPTSYIPTTVASVTRGADVITAAGISWLTQGTGTLFTQATPLVASEPAAGGFVQLSDGTAGNVIEMWFSTTRPRSDIVNATVSQQDTGTGFAPFVQGTIYKHAKAYTANDCADVVDGGTPITDATATIPAAITAMQIGGGPGLTQATGFYLQRLSYWNVRVSNANMQALTRATVTSLAPMLGVDRQLAAIDLDFTRSDGLGFIQTAGSPTSAAISTMLTCSRGSDGYYQKADGTLVNGFGNNVLRIGTNGLLVEESRTNLLQQSQTLDNVYWTLNKATVSADATTAPDGTLTADKLVEDGTTGNHYIFHSQFPAISTTYTFSLYAKAAGRTRLTVSLDRQTGSVGSAASDVFVDLTNGTVDVSGTSGGVSGVMTALANGWYRIALTALSGGNAQFDTYVSTNNGSTSYTGDGSSGVYLWGMQLEAGAFATSYIPTTSGSATRAADVVTMATTGFRIDQSRGVLFSKMLPSPRTNFFESITLDSGSDDPRICLQYNNSGTSRMVAVNSGVIGNATTATNQSAVSPSKAAGAYQSADYAFSINGAAAVTDATAGTIPVSTTLRVGAISASNEYFDGYIQRVAYWNLRLPNTALASLTA